MSWTQAARSAKAWLAEPSDAELEAVRKAAQAMNDVVPEAQREAWQKLLRGLARDDDPKRRERIEALVRACALFGGAKKTSTKSSQKAEPPALSWESPIDRLPGIGPTLSSTLDELGIRAVADLLFTLPTRYDDRRAPLSIKDALDAAVRGERVVVAASVESATVVPMRGRRAIRMVFTDGGKQKLHAWWFFMAHGPLAIGKAGGACLISGKITLDEKKPPRIIHPDLSADSAENRLVVPMGPRLGAPPRVIRKAIAFAIESGVTLPDPIPEAITAREQMASLATVLRETQLARDASGATLLPSIETRRALLERLAWVEAFTRARDRLRGEAAGANATALPLPVNREAQTRLVAELGFSLTTAQKKAIAAVSADLTKSKPMRRLLLGDVGTGKTAVALAAVAQCVASGAQAAILAPTTILAEQYMDAVAPLARATGASIAFVGAGAKSTEKKKLEASLANGSIAVAIGTHALFRESVHFKKLGLVVVDEQHRLGVSQRLALSRKKDGSSYEPHLLTLSATPIPRSLALALRGELATSHLAERPKGRPPVVTEIVSRENMFEVVQRIRAACARKERVFFVAPRIEVDEDDESTDPSFGAVDRAKELAQLVAPVKVVLVHGAMPQAERSAAMRAFRSGEAQLLVGTTVIEVGVDVPEATLMVIDGADRFGLAQLHQMRGRVGRGDRPGSCILMHDEPMTPIARQRLQILAEHADGATVARADLELRGAGDLGGTRQSGVEEELIYLDPDSPPKWLERIDQDARAIEKKDPQLELPGHRALAHFVKSIERALVVRAEAG